MTRTTCLLMAMVIAAISAGCGLVRRRPPLAGEATTMRTLVLDDTTLELKTLYEDDFRSDSGHWVGEGTPLVTLTNGRLSIDAVRGEPHVATVWCDIPFQGDTVIEYTAQVEPTVNADGHGETNLNFFVYASGPGGESVLATRDTRTGAYREYHQLNNYILTYLNSDKNDRSPIHGEHGPLFTRVRFRKDPGFGLLHEAWLQPIVEKGRDYRFTIVIEGARMRFCVDGRKVIDHTDTAPLHRQGHHAFRTWMSHISVSHFRVSAIQ